jgi:hypothetical protein
MRVGVATDNGGFGLKTAPLKELQRKFGFEPQGVVAATKEMLGRG